MTTHPLLLHSHLAHGHHPVPEQASIAATDVGMIAIFSRVTILCFPLVCVHCGPVVDLHY